MIWQKVDKSGLEPETPRMLAQMLSGCDNQLHHAPMTFKDTESIRRAQQNFHLRYEGDEERVERR